MPCRQEWLWERVADVDLAVRLGGGGFQGDGGGEFLVTPVNSFLD